MASNEPRVAYFCMEYGLSPDLTIYSGGLGILAGDFMKSAGDLRLPVIGIGILWDEGYTMQTIDSEGRPVDRYVKTRRDALAPVEAHVEVMIDGARVPLAVHRVAQHTSAELYLLEPRDEEHRWITKRLYGGGKEDRISQEIVLGVGGVRLLRALGIEVDVYHFNEGHAVFAGHELLREERERGFSFQEAVERVRPKLVFTTHTPVPAGNESHDLALLDKLGATVGLPLKQLEALGGSPYGMTVAGLRLACRANAVAELHGDTANDMWKHVDGRAPITAITNGVHVPTWQDARVRAAMAPDKSPVERGEHLWAAHQKVKRELVDAVEAAAGVRLSEDRLLVGFARRAATYKRADLVFGNVERLEALFADRKLQLVFAGKAHPRDDAGKHLISNVVRAARRWPDNVVFLENYDMTIGARLTRGCDVWLNNPRRPMEASGTSGMKAAMNGVLNCSILDGWWPEGCVHGQTGWRIQADHSGAVDDAELDARDREAMLDVLEREVMPTYYVHRDRWVRMMEASIQMSRWRFSTDRMIEDYYRVLYAGARTNE